MHLVDSEYQNDSVPMHCPAGIIEQHLIQELAAIIWRKRSPLLVYLSGGYLQ